MKQIAYACIIAGVGLAIALGVAFRIRKPPVRKDYLISYSAVDTNGRFGLSSQTIGAMQFGVAELQWFCTNEMELRKFRDPVVVLSVIKLDQNP